MHERLRDAVLDRWARVITRHPISTLIVAGALAAAGVLFAAASLSFHTDRSQLVSRDRDWNRRYADYKREFPFWNQTLIVLDGSADDHRIDDIARVIAEELSDASFIRSVDAGFDRRTAPRFWRTAAPSEFSHALEQLVLLRQVAAAPNVNSALATLLRPSQTTATPPEPDPLAALLRPFINVAVGHAASFVMPGLEPDDSFETFRSETGRLRFVFVLLGGDDQSASGIGDSLAALRATVRRIIARQPGPPIEWGVTGIPAIESDETAQSTLDSMRASILAAVAIAVLMTIVFRGVIVPLLALVALGLGIGWSFGWVAIAVGHLQLLSIIFTVILLGLGIDFALHIIARLELVREEHPHLPDAMARVFRAVGPGLVTGALTTAAAFAAIALTDFTGAAETGLISAGGIILCLFAVASALPALLAVTGRWKSIVRHRRGGEMRPFARGRFEFVARRPGTVVIVWIGLVATLITLGTRVRYDGNVLNLQPPNIESVRWEHRLLKDDARSLWHGLLVTQPERAAELTALFRNVPEVSEVGGMGMLFPPDRESRTRAIEEAGARAVQPLPVPPGPVALLSLLGQVRDGLTDIASPDTQALAREIDDALNEEPGQAAREDAWQALNGSFLEARDTLAEYARQAMAPGELSADDLPAPLRAQVVGRTGDWLLRIYPDMASASILDPDRLGPFVASLREVDQTVIGPPVQIYESGRLIRRAYVDAALYALPLILLLLILDFRSLADALCAIVPVVIGFIGVFGLMGLAGVPLNFANMIVMPIILGIGVDAGVHIVHRWRAEPGGRPAGLSGGTGRSVTLTMTTTIVGFACMIIAEHRGIRSLGFVMVVGLGVTLMACYTALPALLHSRMRTAKIADPAVGQSPEEI